MPAEAPIHARTVNAKQSHVTHSTACVRVCVSTCVVCFDPACVMDAMAAATRPRKPKVAHLHVERTVFSHFREKNVGWFQISVRIAAVCDLLECIDDSACDYEAVRSPSCFRSTFRWRRNRILWVFLFMTFFFFLVDSIAQRNVLQQFARGNF